MAKAKRIARQLRQLGDYNKSPASANVTAIYPPPLDYTFTIGHPLHDTPNTCKVSSAPGNHGKAMASAQAPEWQASMERELASMSKHDIYELVHAPKVCKIVGSLWVFKVKSDGLFKSILCTRFLSGSRNILWKYIRSNLSHLKCSHCVGHCFLPRLECGSARCTDSISSE